MTPTVLIRQGGLRFHWDRSHRVYVTTPAGSTDAIMEIGSPRLPVTLEEVHDAIDRFCEERSLRPLDETRHIG